MMFLSLMGLGYLLGIACWIPTISVAIRRLHDISKAGLWVFLVQIPVPVILLTTLLVLGMFGYGMGHQGYSEEPPYLGWLDKAIPVLTNKRLSKELENRSFYVI